MREDVTGYEEVGGVVDMNGFEDVEGGDKSPEDEDGEEVFSTEGCRRVSH